MIEVVLVEVEVDLMEHNQIVVLVLNVVKTVINQENVQNKEHNQTVELVSNVVKTVINQENAQNKEINQTVELVSNVAKTDISQGNALNKVHNQIVELVLNVGKKDICLETAQSKEHFVAEEALKVEVEVVVEAIIKIDQTAIMTKLILTPILLVLGELCHLVEPIGAAQVQVIMIGVLQKQQL